jgi:transposase
MENKVLRVSIGIDVAKDSFYAGVIYMMNDQSIICKGTRKFPNTAKGFQDFVEWGEKKVTVSLEVNYVMESTGVYYENLACFLYDSDRLVHVVLPNKAKKFLESLDNKSKTDKLDSKALGQMGVERKLKLWNPGSKIYQTLKQLTRERETIQKDSTRLKNMIHAEQHSAFSESTVFARLEDRLNFLKKQLKVVDKEIKSTLKRDAEVYRKVKQIEESTPGIAITTIAVIIAETFGFAAFQSMKQLTSFAGYDVIHKESGGYKGKTRISKKGNSHIRRALYMPSLSAKEHNATLNEFYMNLNERKNNGLISGTAVQRKLLCLIYTLWKNDTEFIENYQEYKNKNRLKACMVH